MDKSHKMFPVQLVLLPAGLAAGDRRAVLQDGKRPAANSCRSSETGRVAPLITASVSLQGKDGGRSRLLRLWGSRCHHSHCCQGNALIQSSPAKSAANLGMPLAISRLSAVPIAAMRVYTLERRERRKSITSWLASWTGEALRDPPFSAPKWLSKTTSHHCMCCYTPAGQNQSVQTVFQNQHMAVAVGF